MKRQSPLSTLAVFIAIGIIALSLACADASTSLQPSGTPTLHAENAQLDLRPQVVREWLSCTSWDGGATFSCISDGFSGFDFYYSSFPEIAVLSTQDCSIDATGCLTGGAAFAQMAPVEEWDMVQPDVALPNCTNPPPIESYKRWCQGAVPTGSRLTRIQSALANMHGIGGICDTLAKIGDSLLVHQTLKLWKPAPSDSGGGWAPRGGGDHGPNSWMAIQQTWTDVFWDSSHHTNETPHRNLQQVLAHELDHLNGKIHFGSKYMTPNSESCSLVP